MKSSLDYTGADGCRIDLLQVERLLTSDRCNVNR